MARILNTSFRKDRQDTGRRRSAHITRVINIRQRNKIWTCSKLQNWITYWNVHDLHWNKALHLYSFRIEIAYSQGLVPLEKGLILLGVIPIFMPLCQWLDNKQLNTNETDDKHCYPTNTKCQFWWLLKLLEDQISTHHLKHRNQWDNIRRFNWHL